MSETLKYQQMSIYDFIGEEDNFLPEEKSQEVQPSETVPQVDEAQDESIYYVLDSKGNTREFSPSSDLDTRASNTLDIETYETIVEECEEAFQPTEGTDSALFSVGDTVVVKSPFDVTTPEEDPETWFYLDGLQKIPLEVVGHHKGAIKCKAPNGEVIILYRDELYKIN